MSLWPSTASRHAKRLLATRTARGFADGAVSVALASHLSALGFSPSEIGAIATATLLGSALLTLLAGLLGHRSSARRLLLGASLLMCATGAGFAGIHDFWPLLVVAFAGTLNPSAGDVSVFLPAEQSLLADLVGAAERTQMFALYNLCGALAGALGALSAGLPLVVAERLSLSASAGHRAVFVVYALVALLTAAVYAGLPAGSDRLRGQARPLAQSRGTVLRLSALFSLDSFAGGFVVQSLLALWLFRRFELSLEAAGGVFFATGVLAAGSQLLSSRLAARIGHVRTMVFTHLPANVCLIAAAFMPTAELAIACLLLRMSMAQMDVPARQAYVMAVVPPAERAAAVSVTNVPRSLATALSPLLAGMMLEHSDTGWPLVVAGALKIVYDVALFAQFAAVQPLDEA